MKKNTLFFALLASLTITSGLHAQYQWHIIYSNHVDSSYYGFQTISCFGESCSVVGEFQTASNTPDSEFIIHSTDGGLTWISVDSIPRAIHHPRGGSDFYWDKIQQIDSLDVIAVDQLAGGVIQTFDGWQTFQVDTTNSIHENVFGGDTLSAGYYDVDFSNAAEGMISQGFGFYYSTLDSGKHWDKELTDNGAAFHSYGSGMFRVFVPPDMILTTYDDWRTSDTSFIVLTDSIQNSSLVIPQLLSFGGNDSLLVLSVRWDSTMTHYSLSIAFSSDLGQSWQYSLNDTIALTPGTITPLDRQNIVIAGTDSSGRIVMSTDRGATWQVYFVPLENGAPYYLISSVAVTESGHVIAAIFIDSSKDGNVLAYLEPVHSSVAPAASTQQNLALYPNPSTNILNIASPTGSFTILDPLGRNYVVRQTGNTLDISSLPSGVYFLSDGVSRAKFVKE